MPAFAVIPAATTRVVLILRAAAVIVRVPLAPAGGILPVRGTVAVAAAVPALAPVAHFPGLVLRLAAAAHRSYPPTAGKPAPG